MIISLAKIPELSRKIFRRLCLIVSKVQRGNLTDIIYAKNIP